MLERESIIQSICAATGDVFATMLGLECVPGEAYEERLPADPADGVVSLIGLAGTWVGTGSLSCSSSFACKISSHLLMCSCDAVNEDVLDALAEMTNMIIGNFKTAIEVHVGPLGLSIPTVVFGRNFTTRSIGQGQLTGVPFFCGEDRLDVRVCLVPNRESGHPVRPGFTHSCAVGS